uniref:Anti-CBASS protein Acb1-like N-terminal domain-containing protein n=1 Tax=viral metagenome TaxID=1070528 RepID=A0A6M3LZ88_9ZZZZ
MAPPEDIPEAAESGIVAGRTPAGDIMTPGRSFSSSELYGSQRTFGGKIADDERVFASQREPILKWLVSYVASDIYDQGFRVVEIGNEDDDTLNDAVQKALLKLNAKKHLTRLTTFERRWGTSVLLLAYSTTEETVDWTTPLYDEDGKVPEGGELLQITPYPKNKVNVTQEIKDQSDLRFGLPEYYDITRGSQAVPLKVHWTRVIHDAPRLDEHPYWGLSVMDPVWDDATGWRNIRWALYQMLWRYGMGYPHFSFEGASQLDIDDWEANGGLTDFFVRGVFLSNEKATVKFVGLEGATVNPEEYVEMAYGSMATGSRIAQDLLKGVSAGAVTGSEVNLREYAKLISNEQSDVEDVPLELIRRLMETGQVDFDYENRGFALEWGSAFELNELDSARVHLQESMALKNDTEYMTLNEVRDKAGVGPLDEGGDTVLGVERLKMGEGLNLFPEEE